MQRKSFEHVTSWVFDVDNTLYPESARLFDQIEILMNTYIVDNLKVSEAEATSLRRQYWQDHGTTLAGLMLKHDIDPDPFLAAVHDIDLTHLSENLALRDAIERLPGRKIVFTNGSRQHALQVVKACGLEGVFDQHYGIEDAGYCPKPHPSAFSRVFTKDGLKPAEAAMFEDDPRNLEVPHDLEMRTVLVGSNKQAAHIHFSTDDLTQFIRDLG